MLNLDNLNLFLKLVQDEYKLPEKQLLVLKRRLLADDSEFERVWRIFQDRRRVSGVDSFRPTLTEMLS
jgi:hypothetical protein